MSGDEIRDFWMLPPYLRSRSVWRLSSDTRDLLMRIVAPEVAAWGLAMNVPDTIVGRPIEIDEAAEGATLHVPERVR